MYKRFWSERLNNIRMVNGQINGDCPVCNKTRHFYANIDTGQFDCKLCGITGNAITYLGEFEHKDNKQIAECLKSYDINENNRICSNFSQNIPHKLFEQSLVDYYVSNLPEDRLLEFSKERGLPVEILKKYKLGLDKEGNFTLPVYDAEGKIRDVRRKEIGKDTIASAGANVFIFGIQDLLANKWVFLTEGEWSKMALEVQGYASVGVPGANTLKDEWLPYFKDKEVYIVYDLDSGGEQGVKKVIEKLKSIAKEIRVIKLPKSLGEGKDVRDFFNTGGTKEQFEELIRQAEIVENEDNLLIRKTKDVFEENIESEKRYFSIDYLPDGFLKDYVVFAEPLTEAPLQYHIATALAMVSTVLGRNVYLEEGATTYYPNLYILVIGESGITRKSTAIGMVYKFLPKLNPEHLLGSTMSSEALLDAFKKNYCHIILYDELKHLLINEEKSYGKGLIALFTSLWANPPTYRVDIKNIIPAERIIKEPTLNILAASTPDWLQLKEADVLGGFLGRFLPICSSKTTKRLAIRPEMDEATLDTLLEKLKTLQRLSGKYIWQNEAQGIFKGLYDELCDDFQKEPNKALIQPYWARIDTHIRKLAIIFDACSLQPTLTITKDNLMRAWGIMELITGYYKEMLGGITFSFMGKKEKQLLDMVEETGLDGLEHSIALQHLHIEAKVMRALVDTLLEKELVILREVKKGRKTSRVYYAKKVESYIDKGSE